MRTVNFWCHAPDGSVRRVYVQKRFNCKKISERATDTTFPMTLQGWKDAQTYVFKQNIATNREAHAEAVRRMA